jgi:hypothetical protein
MFYGQFVSTVLAIVLPLTPNEMKYFVFPAVLLSACLAFYGCGHQCNCNLTVITPSFVGYTVAETDSIKIIKYKEGSQFGVSLDSILVATKNYYSVSHADTIDFPDPFGNNFAVTSGFDWKIINLSDNKVISLSDIQTSERTKHCGGIYDDEVLRTCYSPITSFAANGAVINPANDLGVTRYYINK